MSKGRDLEWGPLSMEERDETIKKVREHVKDLNKLVMVLVRGKVELEFDYMVHTTLNGAQYGDLRVNFKQVL